MRVKLIGVSNPARKCESAWSNSRENVRTQGLNSRPLVQLDANVATSGLTMPVDSYGFIRSTLNYRQDATARRKWLALQVLWSSHYNRTPCACGQRYNSFGADSCSQ